ncbi:MAG: hypothetical protein AB7I50_02060 [Vicinamibacterales bacterium]
MADFTIRSEHVDVEHIMRQIRTRIKEKRGVDYTEDEVKQLASVKLESFLNPRAVRSDLVEHYRRQHRPVPLPALAPPPENYAFEDETIYQSHRGPLSFIRKLLNPLLKLFFNPNPLIQVLHRQGLINAYLLQEHQRQFDRVSQRFVTRDDLDALNFEVLNNVVLELTRLSIEVKNLKMRIESMNTRQEFNERRARAFESTVHVTAGSAAPVAAKDVIEREGEGAEVRARRRRRRRGRRRPDGEAGGNQSNAAGSETSAGPGPDGADHAPSAASSDSPPDEQ